MLTQYRISYNEMNTKNRKKVVNNSYIGRYIVIRYNIDNGKLIYKALNLIVIFKTFFGSFFCIKVININGFKNLLIFY